MCPRSGLSDEVRDGEDAGREMEKMLGVTVQSERVVPGSNGPGAAAACCPHGLLGMYNSA